MKFMVFVLSLGICNANDWVAHNCKNLRSVLDAKQRVLEKLLSDTRGQQLHPVRRLLTLELNKTEEELWKQAVNLKHILSGNIDSVENLRHASADRLAELKKAVRDEELEHAKIDRLMPGSSLGELFKSILVEIGEMSQDGVNNDIGGNGGNIEAVVKMSGDAPALIDSADNKYVLSQAKDSTVAYEDFSLLKDLMFVTVLTSSFGEVFHLLGFSKVIGWLTSGAFLESFGMQFVSHQVQIETLGEIGVFLSLLSLGAATQIDFTSSTAFISPLLLPFFIQSTLCFIVFVVSVFIDISNSDALVVGACLALSSNRSLNSWKSSSLYLTGQHIGLGFVLAIMPFIGRDFEWQLLLETCCVCVFISLTYSLFHFRKKLCQFVFVERVDSYLTHADPASSTVVFVIIFLSGILISNKCFIPPELFSFLFGVVSVSCGFKLSDVSLRIATDLLVSIFYCIIGFHTFPIIIYNKFWTIVLLTVFSLFLKFTVLYVAFRFFHVEERCVKLSVLLTNISELALILASRARRFDFISKDVYLLVMSITLLSIVLPSCVNKLLIRRNEMLIGN